MFVMVPSYVMTVRLLNERAKFVRNNSLAMRRSSSSPPAAPHQPHQPHQRDLATATTSAANGHLRVSFTRQPAATCSGQEAPLLADGAPSDLAPAKYIDDDDDDDQTEPKCQRALMGRKRRPSGIE